MCEHSNDDIIEELGHVHATLEALINSFEALINSFPKKDRFFAINFVAGNEVRIKTEGYAFSYLLSPTAYNMTVVIPQIGTLVYPIAVGWNTLNFPEGSIMTAPTAQSGFIRYTDQTIR